MLTLFFCRHLGGVPLFCLQAGYAYGNADSFWFQAELEGDARVFGRRAAQAVVVVNVNGAPSLAAPIGPLATFALGSQASDDAGDAPGGRGQGGGGGSESGVLSVVGFALTDPDRDVDPVKVLVRCSYGFLDLNPAALDGVDFNS